MGGLLFWIIVGLVAGFIAEKVMKRSMGLLGNLGVGLLGAILGGFVFDLIGIGDDGGLIFSILVATVGAILLLFIVNKVRGR
ncbi:MAG: GlsB/YeaQ/YmgE family stress response membrane protein [Bacteroidota bacterium]